MLIQPKHKTALSDMLMENGVSAINGGMSQTQDEIHRFKAVLVLKC